VLVRFGYTRDAAGNPFAIEREAALGAFYYQYDQLQRLAYEGQFVSDERQYENYYEYDAAGNRTLLRHGETGAENLTYYAYNEANELTQLHDAAGWTYFGYDQNGNTVMEQAPSHTRYFDWDGRDMLTGVRSTEQGWTDNVYRYDGLASRVSTLESGGLTYYDWDSINVIQEKDGDGDVTDRQVHGYAPVFSVGDIALMDKSGTPYVPVSDQPGTVWNLLNSAASKANSYAYDAFGVARSASEAVPNLYRFGTKRLDVAPGLYHFIARAYRPTVGMFITREPEVHAGGQDMYAYAGSRPLSRVDPTGLMDPITGLILGRAIRCAVGHAQGILAYLGFGAGKNLLICHDYIAADCAGRDKMTPVGCGEGEQGRSIDKVLDVDWKEPASGAGALVGFVRCMIGAGNPVPIDVYIGVRLYYWCICRDGQLEVHWAMRFVVRHGEEERGHLLDSSVCKALGAGGVGTEGEATSVCCKRCGPG
jgi:RHS repeat-associated protein